MLRPSGAASMVPVGALPSLPPDVHERLVTSLTDLVLADLLRNPPKNVGGGP